MTSCLLCGREWSGKEDDILCAIPNALLASSPALSEVSGTRITHKKPEEIIACASFTNAQVTSNVIEQIPGLGEHVFAKAWSAAMA